MRDLLHFPRPHYARRSRLLTERALEMRRAPTSSEARLFEAVRGARLGVAFRRQVPLLGRFIVDLLAPEVRLVVEVDGGCHAERLSSATSTEGQVVRSGRVL